MPNPGLGFFCVLAAVLWAGLGLWRIADGDVSGSWSRLALGVFWAGAAVYVIRRGRPNTDNGQ